ncbi:MAG: NADH-quinone oxidoreductase subunit J [Chloroflexota bacterium]
MEMLFFMIFAAIAIGSALAMVFSRNAVHSALFLLLNFCMLAALYVLLNAQFIAMAQIVVYAGAIVVLVLFVIMLLGAELGENIPSWITPKHGIVIFLGLVLLTVLGSAVFENRVLGTMGDVTPERVAQEGSVELVGIALFTDYLLAFELTSILLLVGIIGVVILGGWRKVQHKEQTD